MAGDTAQPKDITIFAVSLQQRPACFACHQALHLAFDFLVLTTNALAPSALGHLRQRHADAAIARESSTRPSAKSAREPQLWPRKALWSSRPERALLPRQDRASPERGSGLGGGDAEEDRSQHEESLLGLSRGFHQCSCARCALMLSPRALGCLSTDEQLARTARASRESRQTCRGSSS
eukprot:3820141-Rhodomonas_salina.1